ncbi:flagellar basal-body MS-ring/collar protein FliF [Aquisalimonas asiatica]|uniref:Flagellar M-ring protein n=1 Tax=Aquisalimonas asiatica TaxID=406100 RepID=A0A1H8QT45_9GAMM|nr:flagellar basal-body MS-ring/collar protein FliF [Aquisalimonas asiatica]SEO57345.1 flagellar M-ring protein FliF [Aquisalimonas asiatica]
MAESQALSSRDAQDLSADPQGSADTGAGTAGRPWERFLRRPTDFRQAGLIGGVVAAVALGVGVFFWAQQPSYQTLYSGLDDQDRAQVVESLRESGASVRLNQDTGAVEVPRGDVHEARLHLASQGLPEGQGTGFEMLDEDQRFGTSQFMESARYQRALETELARSVRSLSAVSNARVHLAIPEDSVFIRESSQPTASVALELHGGRRLSEGQVQAIVHMISSSVPEMTEDNVSVVDQNGNLLTRDEDRDDGMSGSQFEVRERLERDYQRRIEELLTPMVGSGRVKAQVNADVDFSREETTEEMFDPDATVIRSEQTSEERGSGSDMALGIPGALTNQPPGGGEIGDGDDNGGFMGPGVDITNTATRNYEVGRILRHLQRPEGAVDRLTVAVLVDQPMVEGEEEGEMVREAMSADQIERITQLVQDAVGFDEDRGDRVNVVDAAFEEVDTGDVVPDVPLMEQPWMQELLRWLIAGVVALALILFVVRPLVQALIGGGRASEEDADPDVDGLPPGAAVGPDGQVQQRLTGPDVESGSIGQSSAMAVDQNEKVEAAREVVQSDPTLAASVVKGWLNEDE